MTIRQSAQKALGILLSEAENRNYDPPVPSEAIAELEWIIANSDCQEPYPVSPENDSSYNDDGEGEDKCANWRPLGTEGDSVACGA